MNGRVLNETWSVGRIDELLAGIRTEEGTYCPESSVLADDWEWLPGSARTSRTGVYLISGPAMQLAIVPRSRPPPPTPIGRLIFGAPCPSRAESASSSCDSAISRSAWSTTGQSKLPGAVADMYTDATGRAVSRSGAGNATGTSGSKPCSTAPARPGKNRAGRLPGGSITSRSAETASYWAGSSSTARRWRDYGIAKSPAACPSTDRALTPSNRPGERSGPR